MQAGAGAGRLALWLGQASTVEDILEGLDYLVMKAVQAGIDLVNKTAVSNAQKIQKWMILPRDFSLPVGEMGPTMKVKFFNVVLVRAVVYRLSLWQSHR